MKMKNRSILQGFVISRVRYSRVRLYTASQMCTTIFKETNYWQVKIEVLAWSYTRTFSSFYAISTECMLKHNKNHEKCKNLVTSTAKRLTRHSSVPPWQWYCVILVTWFVWNWDWGREVKARVCCNLCTSKSRDHCPLSGSTWQKWNIQNLSFKAICKVLSYLDL